MQHYYHLAKVIIFHSGDIGLRIKEKKQKKNIIWNSIAGLVNASEAVILSMVVTRTNGLEDAGILTIAFAVGNLLITVGKYGVRGYQVTDANDKFNFHNYLYTRYFTTFLMCICSLLYCVYNFFFCDYSMKKVMCIFLICMIYVVESIEDVFGGLYQKKGRLDISGIIFTVRWIGILFISSVVLLWKKDLIIALVLACLFNIFFMIFSLYFSYRKIQKPIDSFPNLTINKNIQVLKDCFPLFAVCFLSFYVINAPKYAIDSILGDELQACYGFIAMPVFVIGLINSFIYQPMLVTMSIEWKEGKRKELLYRIRKQFSFIAQLTLICEIGAYIIGIPVLSWLYHTDLSSYKWELLLLLLGGGFLAISGLFMAVLTIMRKQKEQLYGYLIITVLALLFSKQFVKFAGIMGASFLFLILMVILAMYFTIITMRELVRNKAVR